MAEVKVEAEIETETTREDLGIHKDGRREGNSLNWQASRIVSLKADVAAGVARAVASAFEGFRSELHQEDDGLRLDLINVFVEGTAEGVTRFFEELGRVGRDVRNDLVAHRVEKPTVKIDYDLLADKVAERLARKMQANAAPTAAVPQL